MVGFAYVVDDVGNERIDRISPYDPETLVCARVSDGEASIAWLFDQHQTRVAQEIASQKADPPSVSFRPGITVAGGFRNAQ